MVREGSERLSVIIPTLNEAERLGGLLAALGAQTRPPDEIVVADAGSKDGTRELAERWGARVVRGGMPAAGRNAGARAASGELLLFLDADVLPPPDFIARALAEFNEHGYGVATSLIETLEEDPSMRILAEATNLFLLVVQYFVPHAPGFCILARREVHEATGGFNESAILAEDHDYVQRALRQAPFGVLVTTRIPVSMRRLEKEGLVKLAVKYLWAEMHAVAGKPVYSMPFKYEFGAHAPLGAKRQPRWKIVDIDQLRLQMAGFENPLPRLSAQGSSWLARLAEWERGRFVRERVRLPLDRTDLNRLHRYLSRRLALLVPGEQPEREPVEAFTSLAASNDCIELTDPNWLASQGDEGEGTQPGAERAA
jgi:glycosyltransferase involved in cell wall biosynthesis